MADIHVDVARAEDWESLLALWLEDEREAVAVSAEAVRAGADRSRQVCDFMASDCFWILLARCDGEPAGFVHACRVPKADARAGYLYVDEVFVHPAHRRKGVATAMLDYVARLAEELGLAGVRLLVRPESKAARALYRKAGYEEYPSILCQRQSFRGC
jgi:ribosomal protein S18 acetylase RimI-like enzyme